MPSSRPRPSRAAAFGRAIRNFALFLTLLALLSAGLALALAFHELTTNLPPVQQLAQYRPAVATQIFADDGTVVGEFYLEKRYLVPIDRIPAVVRDAFIAAEDDRFYRHSGVDVLSIVRAFLNNVIAGGRVQGGSTITQQVVKTLLLSPQKSYERKIKELILATRLERQFTKDEILYLYLNHIYLGSGTYGVAAAAQEYFGTPIEQISLAQAALLAGLPQAPSRYSPFKHWPQAKARQQYVLERMVDSRFITHEEAVRAFREPVALASRRGSFVTAPYYVEHVRRLLEERYGDTALYALGLRVYTALNLDLQQTGERIVRNGLTELALRERYGSVIRHLSGAETDAFLRDQQATQEDRPLAVDRTYEAVVVSVPANGSSDRRSARPTGIQVQVAAFRGPLARPPGDTEPYRIGDVVRVRLANATPDADSYRFERDQTPAVQGALIALEPATGNVKALVGGYDFETSQFNRATQGARQPGSAFKPLVYAAALDRDFTPASIIVDGPISFADHNSVWIPRNYEERYFGPTTLRDALTFSRNVVTVKLAMRIGVKRLVKYVKQFNIQSPMAPNLSLALGSSEVTLLELASAYSTFANLGQQIEPRFITRITDSQGTVIDDGVPHTRQVMSPETASLVTSMLQSVIERGTGRRARDLGRPAAGKTGTTNDMNDAWFIGYTPQLLAGVWIGFDEKRSLGKGETGGRVAAPLWLHFMERALETQPILDFPVPNGITCVPINPRNGQRARPGDPGARLECFRRGTEPTALSLETARAPADTSIADRDSLADSD
jgi:penicillin-binding protein 1A